VLIERSFKPGDKIKLTLSLPNGFGDSAHHAVVTRVLKNGKLYASPDGKLPPMKFDMDGRRMCPKDYGQFRIQQAE